MNSHHVFLAEKFPFIFTKSCLSIYKNILFSFRSKLGSINKYIFVFGTLSRFSNGKQYSQIIWYI